MKSTITSTAIFLAVCESAFSLPVNDALSLEKRMFSPQSTQFPGMASSQFSPQNTGTDMGMNNGQFSSPLSSKFGSTPINSMMGSTNPLSSKMGTPNSLNSMMGTPNSFGSMMDTPNSLSSMMGTPNSFGNPSSFNQMMPSFSNQLMGNPTMNSLSGSQGSPFGQASGGSMFQKSVGHPKDHDHSKAVAGQSQLESAHPASGKTAAAKRDVGIHHTKGHTKSMAQRHAA